MSILKRVDKESFREIQRKYDLQCKYEKYIDFLVKIFEEINDNKNYECVFYTSSHNSELQIYSCTELKKHLCLSLNFYPYHYVKQKSSVSFNYYVVQSKVDVVEDRLINLLEILK